MKNLYRVALFLAVLAILSLLASSFGYFVLPAIIENKVASLIEEKTGFPAKVELKVPFNFIFSWRVEEARIFLPEVQLNELNIRQFEVKAQPFRIRLFSLLSGDYAFLKTLKASGSFVITPKDLNDFLRSKGKEYKVEVKENTIYLTSYISGIGKVKIAGRLEPHASGASFVAERLVEPKMLTLILYPQVWINTTFSFDLSPADRIFVFEKYFVDKNSIKVFFKLKKEFYDEVF